MRRRRLIFYLTRQKKNTIRNFKFRIVAGHSCRVPPQSLIVINKDNAAVIYRNAYTTVYIIIETIAAYYFFFSLGLKNMIRKMIGNILKKQAKNFSKNC